MTKRYRSRALAAALATTQGLHAAGVMDAETRRMFDTLCLTRPFSFNGAKKRDMSLASTQEVGPVMQPIPVSRQVRLFRNNRNQAIRIPVEFELPGSEATITRDGDRLIIEPVRKSGLAALLDSWESCDEEFPEIDDQPPAPEEIF